MIIGKNAKSLPYLEGFFTLLMPKKGLEPLPLTGHAPQTCASANSATWAYAGTIGEKQYIGEGGGCQAGIWIIQNQQTRKIAANISHLCHSSISVA